LEELHIGTCGSKKKNHKGTMHTCTHENCEKEYASKKSLQRHIRECHGSDDERICQTCGLSFASKASKSRHFQECKLNGNFLPQTVINTEKNDYNRHVHVPVKLSSNATEILDEFKTWMSNGGFSTLLRHCKSISTYVLHLRSFFSFILEAKKTREDLIFCTTQLSTFKEFILFLEKSNYCSKTIANKLFAMERLVAFVYEQINFLKDKSLTSTSSTSIVKKNLELIMDFLKNETAAISPAANRETLIRNCRQSLESEGKWESLTVILEKFAGNLFISIY
jgi:hypothetical protein